MIKDVETDYSYVHRDDQKMQILRFEKGTGRHAMGLAPT